MDITAGCCGPSALLSFLFDLRAGPSAKHRPGRPAGGGIAEAASREVHVFLQTALNVGCRETARTSPCRRGAAGQGKPCEGAALVSGSSSPRPLAVRPPVRPSAPCPVALHARSLAHRAPAPSSSREPAFIKDSVPIEPPSSASEPPRGNRIRRGGGGTRAGPFPAPRALASSRLLRAQFFPTKLDLATRDLLPASPGSSNSLSQTDSSSGPKVLPGAPAPLE